MASVGAANPLCRPYKQSFLGAAHPPCAPKNALIFRGGWGGEPPLKMISQFIRKIHLFQMEMQNTSKQRAIFTISMYCHVELEKNKKNTVLKTL